MRAWAKSWSRRGPSAARCCFVQQSLCEDGTETAAQLPRIRWLALDCMLELLLDVASLAVRAAPARRRYLLADAVTSLVPVVAPGLFRRTQANFARAFHDSREQQAARLAHASIHNFGRMATDFLWIRTVAHREVESFTTLSGDAHLWEALRAGRGVTWSRRTWVAGM